MKAIAREEILVVAVILDKRQVYRPPDDKERWYRDAVALALWHCVERWSQIDFTLDKRHTNKSLRDELEKAIRKKIGAKHKIEQIDSTGSRPLQAADYVAWAIRRKYEMGEDRYYAVIRKRIVVEEVVRAK